MKQKQEYLKEIYQKYEKEKQKGEESEIKNLMSKKKRKMPVWKVACIFCTVTITTFGIVYASMVNYQKKESVWQEPKVYNIVENNKITEEETKQVITQQEAEEEARKVLAQIGYTDVIFTEVKLYKSESLGQICWEMKTENRLTISIDAYDKKLWSFSDHNVDDSKITSTMDRTLATKVANELYRQLGYQEGEYELTYLQKYATGAAWYADFSKVYDGVQNPYQVVRISFVPETKQIWHLVLFDEEFENNEIKISKEQAEEIAKTKYTELSQVQSYLTGNIEKVEAKVTIEEMNDFIYGIENPLPDGQAYASQKVIRKVWRVEINDGEIAFFVDSTTGEIIGGDMKK